MSSTWVFLQVDIVPREERGDEADVARPAAMASAPMPNVAAGYWPQQGMPLTQHHPGHAGPDHMLAGHAPPPQPMHMDPNMMQYYLQHQQQQQQQHWQGAPQGGGGPHPAMQNAYEAADGGPAPQQA